MAYFSAFETEILTKLLLATALGALIGLERELKFSPAGIKTYSIVALGASLLTVLADLQNNAIAGGVVSGVGFLGAGAIFRAKTGVRGLTTAALIWISAAIGMTIGFGYYTIAVATTVVVFVILVIIGYLERTYIQKLATDGITLENPKKIIENLKNSIKQLEKLKRQKRPK